MASSRSKVQTQDGADEKAPWETDQPPAGDVVPADQAAADAPVEGMVYDNDVLQNMMDWCQAYLEAHAANSAEAMAAEVRRILAGEDAEAVLAESQPLNGKEHTEKPFLLHSFELNPTDFTDGWPFFASMKCTIPGTGDAFTLNCGGLKVLTALRRLDELGEYPYAVKVRGKQTRAGFTVLQLVMAGA